MNFGDYNRAVMATLLCTCALIAQVAAMFVPASLAAVLGVMFGPYVTMRMDNVSKRFRTDVDRVLQPNSGTQALQIGGAAIGMLVAAVFAGVWPPALAAVVGIAAAMYFLKEAMGL